MAEDHYERAQTLNTDGTPLFCADSDKRAETLICSTLEQAWECTVHPYPRLSPVDFYLEKHGRVVGILEAKTRRCPSTEYPTVFLNFRKWTALRMAQLGAGVPALFVVHWTGDDVMRWARVDAIPVGVELRVAGAARRISNPCDFEPMIEVQIEGMRRL